MTGLEAKAADDCVFGPPDGPRQGRSWDYEGLLITCRGCGVSWRGTWLETCWGCGAHTSELGGFT